MEYQSNQLNHHRESETLSSSSKVSLTVVGVGVAGVGGVEVLRLWSGSGSRGGSGSGSGNRYGHGIGGDQEGGENELKTNILYNAQIFLQSIGCTHQGFEHFGNFVDDKLCSTFAALPLLY